MPWALWAVCRSEARLSAAIGELRRKALIEDAPEDEHLTERAYTIHRIVQRVARRDLRRAGRSDRAVALLAAVYPGGSEPAHSPQWPLCARLTPHLQALLAGGAVPEVAVWAYLLNQAGLYLDPIADYQSSLPMAQESLRIKCAQLKEDHQAIAVGHANLGVAFQRLERLDEAEAEMTRAVALNEAHRPGSADLAHSYYILGLLLLDIARKGAPERLLEAARRCQQSLLLRRRLFGRRSEPVARALNNLGLVRVAQGRGRAAARLVGAALTISRAVLQPGDERLAYSVMNSGSAWLRAGAAGIAEPLLREALETREAVFAAQPQHPERRATAEWLIVCLLTRARARVNRGAREAEAKRLCAQYGFDLEERRRNALQFPAAPEDQDDDAN